MSHANISIIFNNLQHTFVTNSLIDIENWTSTLVNVEKCEHILNFQHLSTFSLFPYFVELHHLTFQRLFFYPLFTTLTIKYYL